MKNELLSKLDQLGEDFSRQIVTIRNPNEILKLKSDYLGKKGVISSILGGLKDLSQEERPFVGQRANVLKGQIEAACQNLLQELQKSRLERKSDQLDVTLPGRETPVGHFHPIQQVMDRVEDIFTRLGFAVHEGPDVETDYYNFEALNFLEDHPARDMQDTFYIDEGKFLLRTHTSPVQIHVMKGQKPPIQMIAPGAVYRRDTLDLSHSPVFHQVEGLLVDEGVRFSDLKGVLELFLRQFFGPKVPVRFRPSFFPFTEPSAEVDIGCLFCLPRRQAGRGEGCRVCKQSGYLEVMGCGMVSPHVLREVDYDPEALSGFAFGMGIERLAMLQYGINDIRLFFESDVRFLEQF